MTISNLNYDHQVKYRDEPIKVNLRTYSLIIYLNEITNFIIRIICYIFESNDSLILLNLGMRNIFTALLFFISISLFLKMKKD